MQRSAAKVFRDPVHNLIVFEAADRDVFLPVIGMPEFQRLRRIRQLGLSSLVYPGAEHSRFVHSLGTYHVAKRIVDGLVSEKSRLGSLVADLQAHRTEILMAALLHDIGHGPFSHVLEKQFLPQQQPSDQYPRSHEDWTRRIISDTIRNSCSSSEVDWSVVLDLYGKIPLNGQISHSAARDIITSQLDADRLDYLLRDSYTAGAMYGRFDLEWLLHSIRVGHVKVMGREGAIPRLCFHTPKARALVEQYVQARVAMYLQVYLHKTTRAYEAMLRNTFALAHHLASDRGLPDGTPDVLVKAIKRQELTVDEYLELDDHMVWSALRIWARAATSGDSLLSLLGKKARALIDRQLPYRVVDVGDGASSLLAAGDAVNAIREAGGAGQFCCYLDTYEDVPYHSILYPRGKEPEDQWYRSIYLLDERGNTHLAEEDSAVIRALSELRVVLYRLYYDGSEQNVVRCLKGRGLLA